MEISLATFKELMHTLKNKGIGLKVRTHAGWSTDYLKIIGFIASVADQQNKTFGGVVLSNLSETEGIMINNISTISAFELENACEIFEAGKVYVLNDRTKIKALIIE